jgi:hypothetical protein
MAKVFLTRISVFFFSLVVTSAANLPRVYAASTELPYRVGPVSSALGGSGVAANNATEAGWLSPASLVHVKQYHFALSSQQSHREAGDGYSDFGVMLADGGQEKIASGSFSYVQRKTLRGGAGAVSADQKDFQGSLAAFVPGYRLSLGATYRRLIHEQPGADITQNTYSLGMLLPLGQAFGVALVGRDLAGGAADAPPEAQIVPSLAVGLHASLMDILQVRADLVRPLRDNRLNRTDVRGGLESWFRSDFAFRLGGAWLENRDEMWLTTGLGFKGPRLSFGYSFEKELRAENGTRHTFDLWMPL